MKADHENVTSLIDQQSVQGGLTRALRTETRHSKFSNGLERIR